MKTLVLIVIVLAALKYFLDWSIFDIVDSERGRVTVEYISDVWDEIIWPAIMRIISSIKGS